MFHCLGVYLDAVIDDRVCDGTEDITMLQDPYTDTSQLRITNMVYKAVFAIAHAIHNTVCQDTNSKTQCDKLTRIESKQVSQSEWVNSPVPFFSQLGIVLFYQFEVKYFLLLPHRLTLFHPHRSLLN